MKKGDKIRQRETGEIPEGATKLAYKRTHDMIAHYGQFIHAITLDQLAASCYLQGVEDAFRIIEKEKESQPALSYEI